MQLHSLVISNENPLGIGKLIAVDNSLATVEYFSSVASRFSHTIPLASLQWVNLPSQTRCYIHNPKTDTWTIGRIYEWDGENKLYQIDLPDSQTTCAPETIIYVRCFLPIDDPIDILSIKAHETPYFHNLRSRLVNNLIEQRAVSQGMTGLLSANIPLLPQQVAVIQKILTDPLPRYLLTPPSREDRNTEAAIILRQFLLDNPQLKALIIVPPYSVEQWQKDLEKKIYLEEFSQQIIIQSREEQKLPSFCDLLILDGAEVIARMARSNNLGEQDYFERIKRICNRCQCLLLLSPLPILNNEDTFFWMFHLLEPKDFPVNQQKDFVEKIKNPQGNNLNIYSHFLRHSVTEFKKPELLLKQEYDLDERAEDILEHLEKWRQLAPKETHQNIFLLFYQGNSTWLGILARLLETRLTGNTPKELKEDFPQDILDDLCTREKFTGEEEILTNLLQIITTPSEDGDRLELLKILLLYHLAEVLQLQGYRSDLNKLTQIIRNRLERPFAEDKFPKLVIFTSFSQSAKVIGTMLSLTWGNQIVVTHCSGDSREKIATNLGKFKSDPKCLFLVVDGRGESGENLAFVDGVIHFDLPLSPLRLSQRLGRVSSSDVTPTLPPTWLLAGTDSPESLEEAWYHLLQSAFNIFDNFPTDLQLYIEQKLPELERNLFCLGAQGIGEIIPSLQQEIQQEKRRIIERNILDEIDINDSSYQEYFQQLEEYDNQYESIEKAVEGWLCSVLKFNRKYSENFSNVRAYQLTKRTLVPRHELKAFFASSGLPPGVYKREQANEYGQVHLYRLGEKLIDHLYTYLKWDDRGQAFAFWRVEEQTEWIGFRFDYIVEAELNNLQPLQEKYNLNSQALRRQADALFPPHLETIFLDLHFQPVREENLLRILNRPYHKTKDYSLAKSRLALLDDFIEPSQWQKVCLEARQHSEELLRNSPGFLDFCRQQQQKAQAFLSHRQNSQESEWLAGLAQGFEQPRLKLDSVGFIVISERLP